MLQMSEIYFCKSFESLGKNLWCDMRTFDLGGTHWKLTFGKSVLLIMTEDDENNDDNNDDDVDKEDDDDDIGDGVHLQQLPLPVGNVVFQVDVFPKRFHIELKQNTASHPSQIKRDFKVLKSFG